MLTFSKDGTKVFAAIEGEPNDDYDVDPEGGVAIIKLGEGDLAAKVAGATVQTASFTPFNDQIEELRAAGVRIFGPGATEEEDATVAQDVEPEYIAESGDGATLFVALQENNALALVDVATATVTDILPLGFKDHSQPGNGLDPSNEDGAITIETVPVFGMFQPDAIATYEVDGATYIVTANEGDARDYDGFSEQFRVRDDEIALDPEAFPDAASLQEDEALGRLRVTNQRGDTDGDGDFDELYAFGGRSFSIFTVLDGALERVFDSGDQFERIIARLTPQLFNMNNDEVDSFDSRSDDKGPEPEAVVVVELDGRQIAVIGLERGNGLMLYDVTVPSAPEFLNYISTVDPADEDRGEPFPNSDLGPEVIIAVPADVSPSGFTEIVVTNEVRNAVGQVESTEPAICEVQVHLLAEPTLGPNAEAVADDQHSDQ